MNDRYLPLDADELAADEAVQAYVLAGEDTGAWESWLARHPEKARALRDATTLLLALNVPASTAEADEQALNGLWQAIAARTQVDQTKCDESGAQVFDLADHARASRRRRIIGWSMAVAASLLLIYLLQPGAQVWITGPGETQLVLLPDSSTVRLGPNSRLSVEGYSDDRRLTLLGEGLFQVAKGSPFTVETPEGTIAVLGTSFDVDATAGQLTVACRTGRVRVTRAASARVLSATEATHSEGAVLTEVRTLDLWAESNDATVIRFYDARLAHVLARLESYYDRQVAVPAEAGERRLDVALPTDDFQQAISNLDYILGVSLDTTMNKR